MNGLLLAADLGDFLSQWYGILLFALIDAAIAVVIVAVTYRWVFKYVFDFLSGLVAAVVTSPIWLTVIVLSRRHIIKTKEYAHVFARRTAIGRNGKKITLHSFTVRRDDGEYTRLGEFLHKTGIERLPAVFDLLTLRVSLVGVRPLSAVDEKFVSGEDYARFAARPGFVNPLVLYTDGKKEISYEAMFDADKRYVSEKYAFFIDVAVLVTLLVRKIRGEKTALKGEIAEKGYAEALLARGEIAPEDYAAACAEEGVALPLEAAGSVPSPSDPAGDAAAAPAEPSETSADVAPAAATEDRGKKGE